MWRDIPGYEGLYQASNQGEIRTCDGKATKNARYPRRVWKQRVLKQKMRPNKKGRIDARVSLWKDGKEYTHLVSRLVALTWCNGYASGMTVNHKDGNPTNNNAQNLEWIGLKENIQHGFRNGLYPTRNVRLISEDASYEFKSMADAGRYLGRNPGYVSNIVSKGRTYAESKNGNKFFVETQVTF